MNVFISLLLFFAWPTWAQSPLPLDANTLSLWNFNTDTGTSVLDSASAPLNGVATNTSITAIPGISGSFLTGRRFTQSSSKIDFGPTNNSKLDFSGFTDLSFEMIVYLDGTSSIFSTIFDNGNLNISLIDDHLSVSVASSQGHQGLISPNKLNLATAYRISVEFDHGHLAATVNGLSVGSVITSTPVIQKSFGQNENIVLGGNFIGYMDDIRLSSAFREDIIAPQIALISPDLNTVMTNSNININATLSDNASGIDINSVEVRLNGFLQTGLTITANSISGSLIDPLNQGENELEILVSDLNGNQQEFKGIINYKPGAISTPLSLAAFGWFACSLHQDKNVYCWGQNQYGQLGDGTTIFKPIPQRVLGLRNVDEIAVGALHACARIKTDVYCWGRNTSGELGIGGNLNDPTFVPTKLLSLGKAKSIAAGVAHTCAILIDDSAKCWGRNDSGQLGNGNLNNASSPQIVPISGVKQISLGSSHSCALLNSGSIKCWGRNDSGQLGNGNTQNSTVLVNVQTISTAKKIMLSLGNSCAILNDNSFRCWGRNDFGQLGTNNTTPFSFPVSPSFSMSVLDLSIGTNHACAVLTNNTIKCWGNNFWGQLGDGTNNNSLIPVQVLEITNALAIELGQNDSYAILADGSIKSWGNNFTGQLGNGSFNPSNAPLSVDFTGSLNILKITQISAGEGHTCARISDNSVRCWGSNQFGQIGNGLGSTDFTASIVKLADGITPLTNIKKIDAGFAHTCAFNNSGQVYCWGRNFIGLAVLISGFTDVATDVSAGANFTCILLNNGGVKCFGENNDGQLGSGDFNPNMNPNSVIGISDAISISTSTQGSHSCAVLSTGKIKCWGRNDFGQLGNGSVAKSNVPVEVLEIENAVQVSVGSLGTCARLSDGTVKCWGRNDFGQLGDGTNSNSLTPVPVYALRNVVHISSGGENTCARKSNGVLVCWGNNAEGELGNGGDQNSSIPVNVKNIISISNMDVGESHACAVLTNGKAKCWGFNGLQQSGAPASGGAQTINRTPVNVWF